MNILLIAMAVAGLGAGLAPAYAVANDSLIDLPDPTRPSYASGDGVVATGVHGLVLQGTNVSADRRIAVINGQRLAVGERVQGATVTEIQPFQVTLQRAGRDITLRLTPPLAKEKR